MVSIYVRLMLSALIPAALSVIFYLLKRKTSFKSIPRAAQQIIIGVVFGAAAVFGTEFGVDLGGATANARDAAPLCAGLLFGGPAGIIAGVIGGVERWFAALWGAGDYSRIACSVSTLFAGFYAALLRKYMFDDKRPTWGVGLATGIVMEIIHLTVLFLTHLSDSAHALEIVKLCTLPMVLCNGISVMLSIICISLCSNEIRHHEKRFRQISQQVQTWLLLCVVVAYLATTAFVYVLQTRTAIYDTEQLLRLNLRDVEADIVDASDDNLLRITRSVAEDLFDGRDVPLMHLAGKYGVPEINLVNSDGIITTSTNEQFVGFDMSSGEQSGEFMVLTQGEREYVQEYGPITFNEGKEEQIYRKYAGVALSGGFVQVGYDSITFQTDLAALVDGLTKNRHVGENGFVIIANARLRIVSDSADHDAYELSDAGFFLDGIPEGQRFDAVLYGEECCAMYIVSEGYYIISVLPQSEMFSTRDSAVYVNSYMEVLVFALLFVCIYFLIKKLVVNNIRTVNNSLGRIIGGDLLVTVNVRSSKEFASLSDDINSTVTTLKHYIDEAAARIDQELAFAKSIQLAVLPSVFPAFPNITAFDIYASMDTAKEVGGDFYDFYMLGEDKLAFLIADVSGKGIPAAMFMMTAKTMLKNLAETGIPVNEVFTRANEKLCEGNDAGMFVTAWMGLLDIATGHVTYVNAGHNPPLIERNGSFEYLRSRPGFVLAGMDSVCYKMQELDLARGDRIFLYTDGATEATDAEKQLYGEERLNAFLNSHASDPLPEALKGIKSDIDAFVGEAEQFDDITMLMLEYKGKGD